MTATSSANSQKLPVGTHVAPRNKFTPSSPTAICLQAKELRLALTLTPYTFVWLL